MTSDMVDRNVLYSFQYRNIELGREVLHSFHPLDDTWDEILPEVKSFMQGIGFQFNVDDVLHVANINNESASTHSKLIKLSDAVKDGFEHGVETAAKLITDGFLRTLNQSDSIRLTAFLAKMQEDIKNETD